MTIETFYPEMGHKMASDTQIEAAPAYGGKYRVKTKLELKGQGIKFERTLNAEELTPQAQFRVGWHLYYMTRTALERVAKAHKVSLELLLD